MSSIRPVLAMVWLFGLLAVPAAVGQAAPPEASADSPVSFDVYGRIEKAPEIVEREREDGSVSAQAPLSIYASGDRAIRLNGAEARQELGFVVSPRADVEQVDLNLRHITSNGLVPDTPHLRVSVNERAVAQLKGLRQPAIEVSTVSIDPDYIESGYNRLWFDGIHRYTYECQNPQAPELWSEIDALGSEIDIVYKRRPFTGRLSELSEIGSPGFGGMKTLTVITSGETPTADHLKWGALSIQGFVNRADGALPEIEHRSLSELTPDASNSIGKSDIVLVGIAEDLAPLLGSDAQQIDDAYLRIMPSPFDETAFMLVVSGTTPEEVTRAATLLTRLDFPLVDDEEMRIPNGTISLETAPAYRASVDAGVTYRLRDLGFRDITVRQKTFETFQADFLMPADYFVPDGEIALLSLDLAYGADLREDSVLNIFLNGAFQQSIWLRQPEGAVIPGYEVRLDARALRPGRNTFGFEVVLTPGEGGQCGLRSDRHLAFAMKDSSTLSIPDSAHFAELPDLSLLRDTGFPFVSHHDDLSVVRLMDDRSETVAAAWTLVAKLHALTAASPGDIEFGYGGDIPSDAHAVFVGAAASFTDSGVSARDVQKAANGVRIGRSGALHAFKSPSADDRLNIIVTASTSTQLLEAVRSLTAPSHWSQVKGAHVEWRRLADTVRTLPADDMFYLGELEPRARIAFFNARQPWGFVGLVVALLLAMGVLLTIAVRYLRSGDSNAS